MEIKKQNKETYFVNVFKLKYFNETRLSERKDKEN